MPLKYMFSVINLASLVLQFEFNKMSYCFPLILWLWYPLLFDHVSVELFLEHIGNKKKEEYKQLTVPQLAFSVFVNALRYL